VRAGLFEAGVDQILTCPFSLRELWACIFALTRRFAGLSRERSTDETGKPSSDRHNQPPAVMDALDLLSAARCIGLTETERRIWAHLAGRDQPVTAAELLDSVFCSNRHDADSTLVRVHIHRLRKKLKGIGLNIEGLHGYGYRITSATARVDARRLGERR